MSVPALALCMILGTVPTAWAQGSGLIVGVNFANLEIADEGAPDLDRRTGFTGGIFVNMPLAPTVSLQPEVLYSQKGARIKDGVADATIELDYLDVPVLARVTAGGSSGLAIFAGPSFGFKLRARFRTEFEGETDDEDIGEDVESFDLGLVLGAGIQSGKFMLDGRYQWGLSNANKDGFQQGEVKNRVFSILLGIRL